MALAAWSQKLTLAADRPPNSIPESGAELLNLANNKHCRLKTSAGLPRKMAICCFHRTPKPFNLCFSPANFFAELLPAIFDPQGDVRPSFIRFRRFFPHGFETKRSVLRPAPNGHTGQCPGGMRVGRILVSARSAGNRRTRAFHAAKWVTRRKIKN